MPTNKRKHRCFGFMFFFLTIYSKRINVPLMVFMGLLYALGSGPMDECTDLEGQCFAKSVIVMPVQPLSLLPRQAQVTTVTVFKIWIRNNVGLKYWGVQSFKGWDSQKNYLRGLPWRFLLCAARWNVLIEYSRSLESCLSGEWWRSTTGYKSFAHRGHCNSPKAVSLVDF